MEADKKEVLLKGTLFSCFFAMALGIYAAVSFAFDSLPFGGYIRWILSFVCLGFLIGGIYTFDNKADKNSKNYPGLRALIGGISGMAVSLIWHWPSEDIALTMIVGAFLGLLGFTWAKHINF